MSQLHGDPIRNLRNAARRDLAHARRASCEDEAAAHGNRAEWMLEAADKLEGMTAWAKRWMGLPRVSIVPPSLPPHYDFTQRGPLGREVPETEIVAMLAGKPAPKRRKP
jgi:hypothetical protein